MIQFYWVKPFSTPMDLNIQYSKSQCPQTADTRKSHRDALHPLLQSCWITLISRCCLSYTRKLEKHFILCAISILPFRDSSLGSSSTKPKPGLTVGSESGLSICKPEPAEARPKPGPAHHYVCLEENNLVALGVRWVIMCYHRNKRFTCFQLNHADMGRCQHHPLIIMRLRLISCIFLQVVVSILQWESLPFLLETFVE